MGLVELLATCDKVLSDDGFRRVFVRKATPLDSWTVYAYVTEGHGADLRTWYIRALTYEGIATQLRHSGVDTASGWVEFSR